MSMHFYPFDGKVCVKRCLCGFVYALHAQNFWYDSIRLHWFVLRSFVFSFDCIWHARDIHFRVCIAFCSNRRHSIRLVPQYSVCRCFVAWWLATFSSFSHIHIVNYLFFDFIHAILNISLRFSCLPIFFSLSDICPFPTTNRNWLLNTAVPLYTKHVLVCMRVWNTVYDLNWPIFLLAFFVCACGYSILSPIPLMYCHNNETNCNFSSLMLKHFEKFSTSG